MSNPNDTTPPMGEPAKRTSGASTGGMSRSADSGMSDALQRSTERGDEDPTGLASTGRAAGAGATSRVDLGGKSAPGSAPGAIGDAARGASATPAPSTAAGPSTTGGKTGRDRQDDGDDDEDEAPVTLAAADPAEPRTESAAESLGRAVTEIVTGPIDDAKVDRSKSSH